MKTTKLAFAVMLATGLAAAPYAAQAKSHKAKIYELTTSSSQTTGANMKSRLFLPIASGQGGAGPGSDQGGQHDQAPRTGMSNTK